MTSTPPNPVPRLARQCESLRHAFELGRQLWREEQLRLKRCVLFGGWTQSKPSPVKLDDITDTIIVVRLRECAGNKSKAARSLGISRLRLYNRIRKGVAA